MTHCLEPLLFGVVRRRWYELENLVRDKVFRPEASLLPIDEVAIVECDFFWLDHRYRYISRH